MKKLILLAVAAAAFMSTTLGAFAQGRIQFSIPTTQRITDAATGLPVYGPAGTYTFGLYIGPVGATASELTLVGTTSNPTSAAATSPTAGLFAGTNPYVIPATPGVDLTGGSAIAFQIRGWSAAAGSTYETALANAITTQNDTWLFGASIVGFVTPTISPTAAPAIFGTGAGQIVSFSLAPIPEPTTIALAGLGAASLLLFRRRK